MKSLITENQIENGLKNGTFKKDGIVIRDKINGYIVKIIKNEEELNASILPSTLIQINHNIIYQADISKIIDSIVQLKNQNLFDDLKEIYEKSINKLEYYKTHNNRLDSLNETSLDSLTSFEVRISQYIENINVDIIKNTNQDVLINMLDSNINLIFIYLMSTYWLHGKNISNDTITIAKIDTLEKKVTQLYENLLISKKTVNGKLIFDLENSVYALLFLEKNYDIQLINKYAKYDNRCKSGIDFIETFRNEYINKAPSNNYSPIRYNLNIQLNSNQNTEEKLKLVDKLYSIKEKIKLLKNIAYELIDAGNLTDEKFQSYSGEAIKLPHLNATPLALHNIK